MAEAAPRPIDRTGVVLFAVPMAILTISGWVGDALAPTLVNDNPLLLVALNPRLRNLVLASPETTVIPFMSVAIVRLVVSDPIFFWFGRRYGDVAIRWMERRVGQGAFIVLWLERMFRKSAHVMVAVVPNAWICLLAGTTRMRVWVFVLLNIGGTFVRVTLVRILGDAYADPILSFNRWIGEHRLQLTAITFTIVVIAIWRQSRKGRAALETPGELAEELLEAQQEADDEGSPRPDSGVVRPE
jgi:membrane protein DedA with SNARE-associated domain